jgi:hypothetical protein
MATDQLPTLRQVDGYLYSEGWRTDHGVKRRTESDFDFLDRVRHPYFERIREWEESVFARYPPGRDKTDLGMRFRKSAMPQHYGASWELYQFGLWTQLGWKLTPHPKTAGPNTPDFLVQRAGHDPFYIECTVRNPSDSELQRQKRWSDFLNALEELTSPLYGFDVERRTIGPSPLPVRKIMDQIRRQLSQSHAVRLHHKEEGWNFSVKTTGWGKGGISEGFAFAMTGTERLHYPIRKPVRKKSKWAEGLEGPLVVALWINVFPPYDSRINEAAFTSFMGYNPFDAGRKSGKAQNLHVNDGLWLQHGSAAGRGTSAVLLYEGSLWDRMPTLHGHPDPRFPFTLSAWPFETVQYDVSNHCAPSPTGLQTSWPQFWGLPPELPGIHEPVEGSGSGQLPSPTWWTPVKA